MVYILYGTGLEEIEAITVADILRRAQIPMQTVGIGGKSITGAHGLVLETDITLDQLDLSQLDCIVLPGGMGGVEAIEASAPAMQAITYALENDKYVAAICAAPTILGKRGWLDRKKATCYPGCEAQLTGAKVTDKRFVTDGRVVTSRGAGTAPYFAFALIEALCGEEKAMEIMREVVFTI